MTTTIMGRCGTTGQIGIGLATNTLAAGGLRFYHIRPEVGIVAHQAAGNFDLARLGIRLLETGQSPQRVIAELEASDPYPEYRQIGVLAANGASAASTGPKPVPWSGHVVGPNFVAMGNSRRA
jgi:uncharacterized Ntn-hydrolase superfamily protein